MNWLYYLAEANIYLGVFYLAYCLFLTKETYYQLTRAYLLFACVASFILPVLQIGALKPVEVAVATSVEYAIPKYTAPLQYASITTAKPVVIVQHLTIQDYLVYAYFIGAGIVFLMLMIKLFVLFGLMRHAQRVQQDKHKVIYLPDTNVAFSFFNYLFIGADAHGANTIIRHELVHIRQKHSLDIIFLEVLKVVSWFNPFIYLLQNSLKTVHEYIADEQTAAHETDALTYSSFLVNNAYGAGGSSITHSFFNYNLLKKRIIMLNQQRSGSLARLKYLVAIPICASLLCVSTLAYSKTYGWVDIDPAKAAQDRKIDIPLPKLAHLDKYDGVVLTISHKDDVIGFNDSKKHDAPPLLIANGKRYNLDKLKPGMSVVFSADSTTRYDVGNKHALETWGTAAKNGVLLLHGKTATVKIVLKVLPETTHINFTHQETTNLNSPLSRVREDDPAGAVTPSGYKPGYENLTNSFSESQVFENGLSYYQQSGFAKAPTIKDAVVVVGFKVGTDQMLSNIKVVKGSGTVMDGAISDAFSLYKGGVTDKPGFHTYLVHISTHGHTEIEDAITCKMYGYDNHYTIAIAGKRTYIKSSTTPAGEFDAPGYLIRYLAPNIRYPKDALGNNIQLKAHMSFMLSAGKITDIKIVGKGRIEGLTNSTDDAAADAVKPFQTEVTRVLQRYPSAGMQAGTYNFWISFSIVNGVPHVGVGQNEINNTPTMVNTNTDSKPDWQSFGKYFAQNVLYPSADRQDSIGGRVITLFVVDADHNLQYAKVVRTPSAVMGNEVIRVLKKCTQLNMLKPGVQYILPVSFTLGYEDSSTGIEIEPKSRKTGSVDIYNPNAIDIQINQHGSLSLNEVVIRGYIKKQ